MLMIEKLVMGIWKHAFLKILLLFKHCSKTKGEWPVRVEGTTVNAC